MRSAATTTEGASSAAAWWSCPRTPTHPSTAPSPKPSRTRIPPRSTCELSNTAATTSAWTDPDGLRGEPSATSGPAPHASERPGAHDTTFSITVLADPEGNEFCVLEPREIYRDTGPIARVVVDCADPRAMARFWDEAMDWALHEVTDDHAVLRSAKGVGPYLELIRTPGVKTVPDRVHLDLLPYPCDDQEAEVARLRALGATDVDLGQGDVPWTCLATPERHEFCVLAPSALS
ncbi:VOC family protein [Streptomyces sp. LN499]|uniref:VOC family protein n=1 Tax=Streptomyces sp. LN499 TaxID=3112977 RepID=UPI0037225E07